ncbi:MAG: hypothetical protein WDN08_18500 [Rhizomicrobium sp.]
MEQQSGRRLWPARDAVRIATLNRGRYLDQQSVDGAIRLRIHLEAMSGEFAESFAWFDILKARARLRPTIRRPCWSPSCTARSPRRSRWRCGRASRRRARPPSGSTPCCAAASNSTTWPASWIRSYCAASANGIRSVISGKANWTIPAGWSGCFINVTGAPGSTFMFVEVAPAIAGDVAPVEP